MRKVFRSNIENLIAEISENNKGELFLKNTDYIFQKKTILNGQESEKSNHLQQESTVIVNETNHDSPNKEYHNLSGNENYFPNHEQNTPENLDEISMKNSEEGEILESPLPMKNTEQN